VTAAPHTSGEDQAQPRREVTGRGPTPSLGLVGLALAAGRGSRLVPLTRELPKPLCPVGGVALLDHALQRLHALGGRLDAMALNVHHGAPAIITHAERWAAGHHCAFGHLDRQQPLSHDVGSPALWVSHERQRALGTAGAIGNLRSWLDGRGVLVVNADTWTDAALATLIDGWDAVTPRLLVVGAFGTSARVAGAIVPWGDVVTLPAEPAALYETHWAAHQRAGTLEIISVEAMFVDCGTPRDYLRANLAASGGVSVVADDAVVDGELERCVVWPGATVAAGERLVDAVRTTAGRTVLVRTT
jgi:N-acetyl-alpha-D-muramate 1-phosphate uridylyltransferase